VTHPELGRAAATATVAGPDGVSTRLATEVEAFLRDADSSAPSIDELERGADERYTEYVLPLMVQIGHGRFEMGTETHDAAHFCGETPRHAVELSPYAISAVPVTNELYGLFEPRRRGLSSAEGSLPVVDVTWVEAVRFAMWVGCSLPTEAEWEYACGAGSSSEWCCVDEGELHRYAWYSESSGGRLHEVATREPNGFGLFDLHGNVWEWCADAYADDFYERSPLEDPMNSSLEPAVTSKVCRGGSFHALAEMCRTRYRQHEPSDSWANDLGFRLVRRRPLGEVLGR
jgi:sulfatase modifying factor 1